MKELQITAAVLLVSCSLTGCALLPKEEVLPQAPVVRQSTETQFTYTYAQRGDLILTKRYNVSYKAVRVERLSFTTGGLHYDKIYVEKGDAAHKGQLLAELEMGTLTEQARQMENSIASLKLTLQQTKEQLALKKENYQIQLNYMDEEELEDALTMEETLLPLQRSIEKTQDELVVQQKQLEVLQTSIRERRLYAPFDGTVTYVRNVKQSDVTSVNENVVTVSDSASSMFVIDTSTVENFPEGREVDVSLSDTVYPCVVVSAASVGAQDDGQKVYLRTELPTAELSDGDHGAAVIELDRREDCLYIDQGAVKTMNGKSFVYVEQENGLRATVEVETGFSANGMIEIKSGLKEGDAVILK